jgi:hypothetical protein
MAEPKLTGDKLKQHLAELLLKNATTPVEKAMTQISTVMAMNTYRMMSLMGFTSTMSTEDLQSLSDLTWKLLERTYGNLADAIEHADESCLHMHLMKAHSMGKGPHSL